MEHRPELFRLLSALADGQLSPVDQDRLEALLAEPAARQVYLQYVDLHARLLSHPQFSGERRTTAVDALAEVVGKEALALAPTAKISGKRLKRFRRLASYVAVAALAVAATVLAQLSLQPARQVSPQAQQPAAEEPAEKPAEPAVYVATLVEALNVSGSASGSGGETLRPGSRLLSGDFEIQQGIARLNFDSNVELIVEGPARLKLESAVAATVYSGKIVFRADDAAAPFTLRTPSSVLVDLGTEYAVEVSATRDEVHVFSGEVERLPMAAAENTPPQVLAAGEARRYESASLAAGESAPIEPDRFVRAFPQAEPGLDPAAGLLAYEGFDYREAAALRNGTADGGLGFRGSWGGGIVPEGGFARAVDSRIDDQLALNPAASLSRPAAKQSPPGGSFEHVGFTKYFRQLELPLRLDRDGVYYLSFLFRREGPSADPLNAVSVQFRQTEEVTREQLADDRDLRLRMNFGVDRTNELFAHLERIGLRRPLPLSYGETYLLVAKIAASGMHPDQLFLRIYAPDEPVDRTEPAGWSAIGSPIDSNLTFDWLELHINSHTRQTIDEIRLGTNWLSVTDVWAIESPQR